MSRLNRTQQAVVSGSFHNKLTWSENVLCRILQICSCDVRRNHHKTPSHFRSYSSYHSGRSLSTTCFLWTCESFGWFRAAGRSRPVEKVWLYYDRRNEKQVGEMWATMTYTWRSVNCADRCDCVERIDMERHQVAHWRCQTGLSRKVQTS